MNPRKKADITIYRADGTEAMAVPITEGCRRAEKLMEADYIRLTFTAARAEVFYIGTYIVDELFGRFVATEQQIGTYNMSTGGYDYDVTFEAEYRLLNNYVCCLCVFDENATGNYRRKETEWFLTDTLAAHIEEIRKNAAAVGYPLTEAVILDKTIDGGSEARLLSYSGTHILDALKAICETWETEYYIRDHTLYVGKIEDIFGESGALTFEEGVNCEDIKADRNLEEHATRIFAFGGTDNLPASYNRALVYQVASIGTFDNVPNYALLDFTRVMDMRPSYFVTQMSDIQVHTPNGGNVDMASNGYGGAQRGYGALEGIPTSEWLVTIHIGGFGSMKFANDCEELGLYIRDEFGKELCYIEILGQLNPHERLLKKTKKDGDLEIVWYELQDTESIERTFSFGATERLEFEFYGRWEAEQWSEDEESYIKVEVDGTASIYQTDTPNENILDVSFNNALLLYKTAVMVGDTSRDIYIFPRTDDVDYNLHGHAFIEDSGTLSTGDTLLVQDDFINFGDIPDSFFTTQADDPSAIKRIGEKRLILPNSLYPLGYVGDESTASKESVVVFPDVFPKLALLVADVAIKDRTSDEQYADGSLTTWLWRQYTLKLANVSKDDSGQQVLSDFPFKERYVLPQAKLQIKFLSPQDAADLGVELADGQPCRLSGMTFNVDLLENTGKPTEYTIVRNEDYGTKLPNEILCPAVGDPVLLLGWNPKVMPSLGLISIAEKELARKAKDYLAAVNEKSYTYTCNVMSDAFLEQDGAFELPRIGRKVTVRHKPLTHHVAVDTFDGKPLFAKEERFYVRGGIEQTSRVLAYELKLDIPYDTPTYTVGESEIYSRLKKIEKEIQKLS